MVIYHPAYLTVYSKEAAAEPGRIEAILKEFWGVPGFVFTQPEPANVEDIRRVHTQRQIDNVKSKGNELYDTALLSAGGALLASEMAMAGEVSMAINRPPGHHAGPDSSWGFCYFNNIAVAVMKLLDEKKIERALIVDFDLHWGDGTFYTFDDPQNDDPRVTYFHLVSQGGDRTMLLQKLEAFLAEPRQYDILAVSAGFDASKSDWGGIFEIQDYTTIGTLLKRAAERNSSGRRFAVLEGGYNQKVLGKNVKAFLDGFR
ncbi:MAG: histone deacetylase family protein [Chloroflexi bacterium]|nr:histone deacetylase family protein [Chloroflexota bacterium]